jgi:uncharacterized UBP type Zn finger protein
VKRRARLVRARGAGAEMRAFTHARQPDLWDDSALKPIREKMMSSACSHLNQITVTETDVHVCPECVALGDRWVHLRLCLICGHVGCCDNSKNKHATKHAHSTGHPLIRSIEPGESWVWCYADQLFMDDVL